MILKRVDTSANLQPWDPPNALQDHLSFSGLDMSSHCFPSMQSFMNIAKSKDGATVRQSDVFSPAGVVVFLDTSATKGEMDDLFGSVAECNYKVWHYKFGKSMLTVRQELKVLSAIGEGECKTYFGSEFSAVRGGDQSAAPSTIYQPPQTALTTTSRCTPSST